MDIAHNLRDPLKAAMAADHGYLNSTRTAAKGCQRHYI